MLFAGTDLGLWCNTVLKVGAVWLHSLGFTCGAGWWHIPVLSVPPQPVVWCWGHSGSLLQAGAPGQVCSISMARGMLSSAHTDPQCDFGEEEWIPLHGILAYLVYPPYSNLKVCFRFLISCKVLLAFKMPSRLSILIH